MITIGATTWSEHKALITEDRPVTQIGRAHV